MSRFENALKTEEDFNMLIAYLTTELNLISVLKRDYRKDVSEETQKQIEQFIIAIVNDVNKKLEGGIHYERKE